MPKMIPGSILLILLLSCLSVLQAFTPSALVLKFNPALIARGDYECSLEAFNLKNNSFEFSAGLTGRNFLFNEVYYRLMNTDYTQTEPRRFTPGFSLKTAFRLYSAQGFFFSPQLAYIQYRHRFPLRNIQPETEGYQNEKIVYKELRLLLGYRRILAGKWSAEAMIGAGLKHRSVNLIEEQGYYDDSQKYVYAFGTYRTQHYVPGIYLGCKIGYLLK